MIRFAPPGRGQRRTALVLAILLLAYTLFGFLALPRLLRSAAQDTVRERLGRELVLGKIRFNPFTLTLTVDDARLADRDGTALFGFKRLLINAELSSLWHRGAVLASLQVDEPAVQATIRPGGELNLADLEQLAGPADSSAPPAAPLRLRVDHLAIRNGQAVFRDLNRRRPFEARLVPITFELRAFSNFETSDNAYHFTARSDSGEQLDWSGSIFLNPLHSTGQFRINELRSATIADYLRDTLSFDISSGMLNLAGGYQLTTGAGPAGIAVDVADLDIRDLGLRPRGGAQDYLQLKRIHITGARADLVAHRASVEAVRLEGGEIAAWLTPGGKLNLLELVPANAAAPAPPSTAAPTMAAATTAPAGPVVPARAWSYDIAQIGVADLGVSAEDRGTMPAASLRLQNIAVQVGGYSSDLAKPVAVTFGMQVGDKGRFTASGNYTQQDGSLQAKLAASAIDLTAIQPYLNSRTDMTLTSGLLDAEFDVQRGANAALAARGDLALRQVRSIDNPLRQDFVKWDALQLRGVNWTSAPQRVRIREIVARAPYARVIVGGDQTLNLTHVMHPPGYKPPADEDAKPAVPVKVARKSGAKAPAAPTAPAAPAVAPPFDIAIERVRIEKGSANYADFWITPNFAVGIQDLNGTIVGLSSNPASRAKVDLKGTVDRYAPAIISGEINPLTASVYSDIAMSFHNMEMTTVSPYSGHFAGYKIEKGKLSVDLSYRINDRKLDAGHRFVIDQLQLGERVESADATSLPVRLAVALLKDRNGVIDVSLPVTGTLDDPKFRVGPLIWKAVVNLIVKAATAPFALLGSLFGGGEEINQISFAAGSAALDPAAQERLQSLRKGLIERPGLQLDVPAAFAPQDRDALLRSRLDAKLAAAGVAAEAAARYRQLLGLLRAEAGKDVALPPLTAAYEADRKRQRSEPPPADAIVELEAALRERVAVSDAELADLGRARAAAIQDSLLSAGEIDAARVFVINAPPASADVTTVRLDLALK